MSSRDPSVNITYGIMTMLYLTTVVVLNTLNIRLYEQEVLIPLQQGPKKKIPKFTEIELIGKSSVIVPQGTSWTDPGAKTDKGLTVIVDKTVDTSKLGRTVILYTAKDSTNNITYSSVSRVVEVQDKTAPVLTLNGTQDDEVIKGDDWTDPGVRSDTNYTPIVTTYEKQEGDKLTPVSKVDTGIVGKYIVTYSDTDAAGNVGTITRTVNVKAAPVQQQQQQQQFTNIEKFGNIGPIQETKLETTTVRTTKINKEAVAISESILMGLTLPLAFGYIIGFDCSCPPNENHVGKIVFSLGVFIPMIFIIVNEIIGLLFPDIDVLNPFLPVGSSDADGKKHFFNKQYRKTFCWCLVTFTFIIHFFSVAFGQQSGVGSVDII
jgi:hypothetical protein